MADAAVMMLDPAATGEEVEDQYDHGENQQDVNQSATDVQAEAE